MATLIWISRHHNRVYTGNTALIATLHERLEQQKIVALSGLGGMGKSELAMEYIGAYEEHSYNAIVWLDASSSKSINEDYSFISTIQPILFNHLWLDNKRTLLILDNVRDISMVKHIIPLSQWQGHAILITRFVQSQFPMLPMSLLSLEESALLVLRRGMIISEQGNLDEASKTDRNAALAIAREMDGFPLALEQAGTYMAESGCRPASYLSTYRGQRRRVLGIRQLAPSSHPEPSLVEIIEETAHRLAPTSQKVLRVLASLSPDAVEWQNPPFDTHVLDDLISAFLVQRCDETMLCMHRLVQMIIRGQGKIKHAYPSR